MMKVASRWTFLSASVAFFLLSESSPAAGFDCAKAKIAIEKMVCADDALSQLDSDLKAVFDEAQSERSSIDGETGRRSDPVGLQERAWIKNVRNKCRDLTCLKIAYTKRIAQIREDWLK